MSFEVTIKGTDNLPAATTNDPETHGQRLADKAAYDEEVRDAIQRAVDLIGRNDATATVTATGTIGEIGPITLTFTPAVAKAQAAVAEARDTRDTREARKPTAEEAAAGAKKQA